MACTSALCAPHAQQAQQMRSRVALLNLPCPALPCPALPLPPTSSWAGTETACVAGSAGAVSGAAASGAAATCAAGHGVGRVALSRSRGLKERPLEYEFQPAGCGLQPLPADSHPRWPCLSMHRTALQEGASRSQARAVPTCGGRPAASASAGAAGCGRGGRAGCAGEAATAAGGAERETWKWWRQMRRERCILKPSSKLSTHCPIQEAPALL